MRNHKILTFKVKPDRVFPYLSKYSFESPKEYFVADELENGYCSYSISRDDLSLNNPKYENESASSIKEKIGFPIDHLKDNNSEKAEYFEELLFLFFYIAASKANKPSNDFFINNHYNTIINIVQSMILIKRFGLHSVGVEIKPLVKLSKKQKEEFGSTCSPAVFNNLDLIYSSYRHVLTNICNFLHAEIGSLKEDLLKPDISLKELVDLKDQFVLHKQSPQKLIQAKGALMIRDFLIDYFDVKMKPSSTFSADQIGIIYAVYSKMGWQISRNITDNFIDRFRKELEYYLHRT